MGYEANGLGFWRDAGDSSGHQTGRGPKGEPAPCQNVLRSATTSSISEFVDGCFSSRVGRG